MKTLKIGGTFYVLEAFKGMSFEDFEKGGHACGMDAQMVYDRVQKELSSPENAELKIENTLDDVPTSLRKNKRDK